MDKFVRVCVFIKYALMGGGELLRDLGFSHRNKARILADLVQHFCDHSF